MTKSEYNPLDLILDIAEQLIRIGRPLSIPALVDQTIKALDIKNKQGIRPERIRTKQTPTGYNVTYSIPTGLKSKDLGDHIPEIQTQTGAALIDFRTQNNKATFEIHLIPLKKSYPYNFNPETYSSMIAPIPIGIGPRGLIVVDLAAIPHLFVGGTTGGGKSNVTISTVCSLLLRSPRLQVVVIDRKKTDYLFLGDRVKLAVTEPEARDLLEFIRAEMRRRQDLFAAAGVIKYQSYIKRVDPDLPYLVLVIDELAQIKDKATQEILLELLQLSRSGGISIIAATQRPSSTMFSGMSFGDFKALFGAAIACRTKDQINSRMILDNSLAANLPPIPGRIIWQYESEGDQLQALFLPVDPEDRPAGYPLAAEIVTNVRRCVYNDQSAAARLRT